MDRQICNNCGMELVEVLVGSAPVYDPHTNWERTSIKQWQHLDPNEAPYYQCKLYATPVTPELGARGMRNLIGDRFYDKQNDIEVVNGYGVITDAPKARLELSSNRAIRLEETYNHFGDK